MGMNQQDILERLRGKEGSVVFLECYGTPSRDVHSIYVGTETVCSGGESHDAIVIMYRDWQKRRCVDIVLLQDGALEVSDHEGQLRVRYTKPDSSTYLTESHKDYEALQKLVDKCGL